MTDLKCFGNFCKVDAKFAYALLNSESGFFRRVWINSTSFFLNPFLYPVLGLMVISPAYGHWVNKGKKHGVSIWVASSKHGEMAIKAQCQVKTDLSSFVAVMNDLPNMPKWVAYNHEVKILKRFSATEDLVYSSFILPWPAQNRDMVTYSKWSEDKMGVVHLDVSDKGVDYPKMKGFTRITHITGHWSIIPIKGGLKIIKYEGQANPGGWLPQWFVNRMRVKSTRQTMAALCYQVTKPEYQHHQYSFIRSIKEPLVRVGRVSGIKSQ